MTANAEFSFKPLTPETWPDLLTVFGKRGGCAGCWCMWWRLTRAQWKRQQGDGNRRALKKIVDSGVAPGILAYASNQPVGWCAIAPRRDFSGLQRSRILKPVDDQLVWSVVCFVIVRAFRRRGVSEKLLQAAVEYAGEHGARIVEGYPVEPRKVAMPDVYAYTGIASAFIKAGFKEVARRSPTRPIMRYFIATTLTVTG